MVDALALRLGFYEVIKVGCKYIQAEGNSKIIIDALNGEIQAPWPVDFIVKDIKTLMETSTCITIHHIFRKRKCCNRLDGMVWALHYFKVERTDPVIDSVDRVGR